MWKEKKSTSTRRANTASKVVLFLGFRSTLFSFLFRLSGWPSSSPVIKAIRELYIPSSRNSVFNVMDWRPRKSLGIDRNLIIFAVHFGENLPRFLNCRLLLSFSKPGDPDVLFPSWIIDPYFVSFCFPAIHFVNELIPFLQNNTGWDCGKAVAFQSSFHFRSFFSFSLSRK